MKKILFFLIIICNINLQVKAQHITEVNKICITVSNLNDAVQFYTKVLPFEVESIEEFYGATYESLLQKFGIRYSVAHLKLGNEKIDLIDYLTAGGRSYQDTQKSNDLSFQHIAIVVSNMDKAFALLQQNNVEYVSTSPQTIPASNAAAAGIKAFYFHDKDNHTLELIYFPKGKGNPKWQQTNRQLFLGIDHTAIGISNTDSSAIFWNQILDLKKKGESHNTGTEQAHLNNVAGAELHITGNAADKGPGVEFLQYLMPGAGNATPSDTQCDDLWNWITVLNCDNAEQLHHILTQNKNYTTGKMVNIHEKNQFITRDQDGHAIWIIQQ